MWARTIALRASVLCASLAATACAPGSDAESILDRYEYRPSERAPYAPVAGEETRPASRGALASMRVRLPQVSGADPAVYVPHSWYLREIWLGDRRIYRAGEDSWTVLALPPDHAGQALRVDYRPRSDDLRPRPVRVGSYRHLLRRRIVLDLPELAVGAALLIIGVLVGAAGLRRRAAPGYRELGAVAFLFGVLTITQTEQLMAVVHPSPGLRLYAADAAFFAIPGALALFVRALFGDTQRSLLLRMALLSTAIGVAGLAYDVAGLGPWSAFYPFDYACVAIVLAGSGIRLWHGLRSGDLAARTVLAGLIAMTLIGLPDIGWGLGLVHLGFQTGHWAMLTLIASLILALERRFVAQSARLVETSSALEDRVESLSERNREIDALNQELRHQISARSRQLSSALAGEPTPPPSARQLREGTTFEGRYRVLGELGAGGMGTVHAAERLTDGRIVALKVMSGDVSRDRAARFMREAEIAAKFAHPNLVPVLDVGLDAGGTPFLVMEKVNGTSLEAERARFGDAPWAMPLLRDVAEALVVLHREEVVHRDLKPGNVLLDVDAAGNTTARVSDFGISHLGEPAFDAAATLPPPGSARGATPRVGLTRTGALLGTPAYMAPELALGARCATPASDVYAFGLMACEMFGYTPPDPMPAVFLALAGEQPTPPTAEALLAANAGIPPPLAELAARALALDPKARPSAEELSAALASVVERSS